MIKKDEYQLKFAMIHPEYFSFYSFKKIHVSSSSKVAIWRVALKSIVLSVFHTIRRVSINVKSQERSK